MQHESLAGKAVWAGGELTLSRREGPNQDSPKLVLAPSSDRPAAAILERLEHAYALRDELAADWAARPLSYSARLQELTIEDPGGAILSSLVGGPWELRPFLRVAIGLASSLRRLHERGLVHRDLSPSNLFVDISTGRVWLSGFGLASRVPRERQTPEPPELIAGTLAYMAPEQTGRMNRSSDARSDLYSCGIVLYEVLTGALPFVASEPMEWIHCHVARRPAPPSDRVNGIPAPVSAIIMKLLAKNAEDRYQTAAGLEADLQACLDQYDARNAIPAFTLGASDVADRLVISERLYGREQPVAALAAAFTRVVHHARSETVFVSGYSGIGKSSVVHELQKNVVHVGGTFASAKAEPYSRGVPYLTLARALRAPVRSLLARRQDDLDAWKRAFQDALGSNGQLMVNLLPDLALVIGEQPPVPELPPHEASNRFRGVFGRFIQVFAQPGRPLVLFLDDLQWLDESTFELLESLVTSADTQHLLLVGAYRDNELDLTHPLMRGLDRLRSSGARYGEVVLASLTLNDLVALIADTLRADPARVLTLSRLVHAKTGGNPFFAIQFLRMLYQEGLLRFDRRAMSWAWDQSGIEAQGYTDNIIELMVAALRRLHVPTRTALTGLACLGHAGEIATLSLIQGQPIDALHADLSEAVRAGLVVRTGSLYAFSHDRIQEAAYSLVDQDGRAVTHLRIGRLLRQALPAHALEQLFEVVSHLNRASDLLTTHAERVDTATLNLEAGKAAMAATAHASALRYLVTAEGLLGDDATSDLAGLRFEVSLRRANCEVQTGAFDAANDRLSSLQGRAATLPDQAAVTGIQLVLHMATGRPDLAVQVCLRYLRTAGIGWDAHPAEAEVRAETERIVELLSDRSIESLAQLPIALDADFTATMDVLCAMVPAAILTDENLLGLVVARMATLSIERGNTDGASYAYVLLNMVVGLRFGDYRTGARFGHLSVDLVAHRGLNRFTARVYLCFGSTIVPWTQALETGRDWITRARDAAVSSGDLLHYAYSGNCLVTNLLATGQSLVDVEVQVQQALAVSRQLRFGIGGALIAGQRLLLRVLRGPETDVTPGSEQSFDPLQFEAQLDTDSHLGLPACWYWIRKLQAAFYAADVETALAAASRAEPLLWTSPGFFELAEYQFFRALALAAKYNEAAPGERSSLKSAIESHHRQLAAWAESCVENFSDRVALVGAEIARLDGRVLEALRLYERAIQLARARDFVHNEGLANELAARCCVANDLAGLGRTYLLNARQCYERWGALGKVRQMDERYGLRESATGPFRSIDAMGTPVDHLDLGTIVRVSQAVSNEIVLDRLVERLMVVAMQHAGGERGLLILPRGSELRIVAEAISTLERIDVRLLERPPTQDDLPESVLALVVRTKDAVILDDASAEAEELVGAWRRQRGSILCLPLVNQAVLAGVLYIENMIASHAFTPAAIAVLKLIASQAAVSIEKARLYADLRETDAYLAQAQGLSHTGSFGWTPATATIAWSDETFRIFEVDRATTPTVELVMARTHPEDRARVQELVQRVSSDLSDWDLEHRLLMPNGSVKHLRVLAQVVPGLSSGPARFVGAIMDVTGSRQSQQALETAFREIQTLRDQLQEENVALREEIDRRSMFEELVGESPALRRVLANISKVAPTDSSVLITGETGTGKELVARAIHKRSARASRPFVGVNCAAVPSALIASELFGHERGAFTGATEKRVGRFELADGGTLFLDEVGDLPADTQVALLRVLQEREFERVGGTRPIRVNVRVIAATNRDLESAIAEKTFRADLYYRLNVFPLEVPSLRDRREDIPLLVEYFVNRFGKRAGKPIRGIGRKALEQLKAYAWPGNIRELQNVIERAVIISDTGTLTVDARWLSSSRLRSPSPTQTLVAHEKLAIEAALSESKGRVSGPFGAALKLGVPASTLETKIKVLQIDKRRFKVAAHPTSR